MPTGKAPRFTQKPSIRQTPEGHLLMECLLESQPKPTIKWFHGADAISAGGRVSMVIESTGGENFKVQLLIKDPTADDGGAYKCNAANEMGDSNANINLNFAGGGEEKPKAKGPTFVGKPRIVPKDGGALIVMEARVKSTSKVTTMWHRNDAPLSETAMFHSSIVDEADNTYFCTLEIRNPSVTDGGAFKCIIKNAEGEVVANLALNFEQAKEPTPPPIQTKIESKSEQIVSQQETVVNSATSVKSATTTESTTEVNSATKTSVTSVEASNKTETKMDTTETNVSAATAVATKTTESSKVEAMDVSETAVKRHAEEASKITTTTEEAKKAKIESTTTTTTETTASGKTTSVSSETGVFSESSSVYFSHTTEKAKDKCKRVPVFMETAKSQTVNEGEAATIQVELQCHTSTEVKWLRDGAELKPSANIRTSFDGINARLTILHADETNCGLIKCHAKSQFGEAQSSAMINLVRKPEEEKRPHQDMKPKDVKPKEEPKPKEEAKPTEPAKQAEAVDKAKAAEKRAASPDTKSVADAQNVPDAKKLRSKLAETADQKVPVCFGAGTKF